MATSAQLGSVTVELINRLDSSIIAKGTGFFIPSSLASAITNIRLGFIYSTQPISITTAQSISNTTTTDTLVPISGQVIDSLMKPEIYSGTSSSINWDYSAKIGALLPNTTYYVRAYCSGYYDFFVANVNKYGAQFSISTYGASDAHGYYISNDTVGFYDPLQVRDASEGVERVLTSDSSGLATWKPIKSLFSFGHYIGEKYGGGIVAAVWKEAEDEKVLIVSNDDITSEDGVGIIGTAPASIQYKMGTGNYYNNPGTAQVGSCYLTFHNTSGTGPYAGTNNPQDIAVICIHNFDNSGVNQENFLKSLNGTGNTVVNPANGIGAGTYEYSATLVKGLFRVKTATTTNIFRVVGYGTYYSFAPAPAKFIAASYEIAYVGSGTVPGTTMGVFRLYVDYIGSETSIVTSGAGKFFPAAGDLITIAHDATGTGLNYVPVTYMSDFKWSAGVAQTTAVGSFGQSLYNGDLNSDAIIAQSNSLNTIYSAAKVCADYRGSGYDDWYLPSYYELNQVYNQAAIINKVLKSESLNFLMKDYWTSTEYILPQPGVPANSTNAAISFNSFAGTPLGSDYSVKTKSATGRIRAVRKESVYTGDGLIMSLDATNKKSFSDVDYLNIGTSSKWRDLVNGGLTSSYSFDLSAYPTISSGTLTNILNPLGNGGSNPTAQVGSWYLTNISLGVPSTPKLYNNGGTSSFVSNYFLVSYPDARLEFQSLDQSLPANMSGATLNIYVSVRTGGYSSTYNLIKQVTDNTNAVNFVKVLLYSYYGKTISIKVTAPNASYTSTTQYVGPSFDEIYVIGTNGGHQATGPIYFPYESGFLRFNGTGSNTDDINYTTSFGSYVNFKAPVGLATTVTVEMWVRMRNPTTTAGMLFGWSAYDVLIRNDSFGFNTGNGDIYGISAATVQNLNMIETWTHCVFEMRSDVSYTNNKIYINGNLQTLSAQSTGTELTTYRNFNGGVGKIGGWGLDVRYMFNGDISTFRIYNRPLTKDEIMKNYSFEKKRYEILPKLLTNNIFTSIDFDNETSYSGGGTMSGPVNDLSGNVRNAALTISGTTTIPAVQRTNILYNGKELIFPGTIATNPYLAWTDSVDFQGIQNLSVSFWVKLAVNRNSTIIVRWNNTAAASGPWEVFQTQGTTLSTISFRLKNGAVTVVSAGTKGIPLNKWTHVCATFDNTTKKMKTYIDSVLDINFAAPSTFTMATGIPGDVIFGRYSTAVNPIQGSLGSIQIYNKSLSYGEVRNNYDTDKFRFDNFDDANKFYSHEINGNPTFSISQNLSLEIGEVSNEKILKLNSLGYSKWTDKNAIFSRPTNYRYIGELYGGGIIVAMWYYPKTIFNYLIMSLEDVSTGTVWSNRTGSASNATSDFKGEDNQTNIITQALHTNSAAKLCDDYAGGGFTDWYLPSVFEMNHAFNAGSTVGTVLGSDLLVGQYWTSTEISETNAYFYSFEEALYAVPIPYIGYQKSDVKSSTKKVRAFRLATNAVVVNIWDPTWDEDWTPWWRGRNPWWWEWRQGTYNIWDFDYGRDWRRTSVSIDPLPLVYQAPEQAYDGAYISPQGYVSMTFSNSIYGGETVLSSGVCWSTTSQTPTLADSVVYDISGKATTPNIMGLLPGTTWDGSPLLGPAVTYPIHFIYLRAFVTTPTGTYYSSNSGVIRGKNFINGINGLYSTTLLTVVGTTYSTSTTTYATYPTGCLVFHRNVNRNYTPTGGLYE